MSYKLKKRVDDAFTCTCCKVLDYDIDDSNIKYQLIIVTMVDFFFVITIIIIMKKTKRIRTKERKLDLRDQHISEHSH